MVRFELDSKHGILHVMPSGVLTAADFDKAERAMKPVLDKTEQLNGIVIEMEAFPGWAGFPALKRHIQFIASHHHDVRRIAVVSDDVLAAMLEKIAELFVSADMKRFDSEGLSDAWAWIRKGPKPNA